MNSIDINDVTDENELDIFNSKNMVMSEDRTFFQNIDENLERIIYDVGLDKEVISAFIGKKISYKEFLDTYEDRFKKGLIKKSKAIVEGAYGYAIMFLKSAFISKGDKLICVDGDPNGMLVFSELYEKFKPEDLPYGNINGFVEYYHSQNQNMMLERKKG